ncbi:type VI secretion system protein ImpM [Paraburkholderia terricola]|uniref:type VI secretion system-associated protein TagF n=1 Tax=Paraburkholderia terricola TaxID=169427 RepID=UPI0011AC3D4C|nr:type VI secretion system-associated protein TagF [Paraburkholderia terricola]MDR6450202.1 type VI secretion system protein ImpM [Paraburkholderia terricola]
MSGQVMRIAEANGHVSWPGWYGKVPGAGDFVNRGVSAGLAAWWDRWIQQGMDTLRQGAPDGLSRHFAIAPVWNFVIPAGAGADCVQLGSLAPSCDRVGRYYPVIATLALDAAGYSSHTTASAGGFFRQVGAALLDAVRDAHGPEQLDLALGRVRLPRDTGVFAERDGGVQADGVVRTAEHAAAWPNLAEYFDPHGMTSFWWTYQADDVLPKTHAHTGSFDARLFQTLFGVPPRDAY